MSATSSADQTGPLQCRLAAPSYSPDGSEVVLAEQPAGAPGWRLLVERSEGSDPLLLPGLTADDVQPALLYSVSTDGGGLRRLTRWGGSEAAPPAQLLAEQPHGGLHPP